MEERRKGGEGERRNESGCCLVSSLSPVLLFFSPLLSGRTAAEEGASQARGKSAER